MDAGDQSSDKSRESESPFDVHSRAIAYARIVVRGYMKGHRLPHPHDERTVATDAYIEVIETHRLGLLHEAFGLYSNLSDVGEEARYQFRKIIRGVYDRARYTHKAEASNYLHPLLNDSADYPRRRRVVPRDVNLIPEAAAEILTRADPRANLDMILDVRQAMDRLPDREREIILDNLGCGKSVREIAEERRMTEKKVRGIIETGKKILADTLTYYNIKDNRNIIEGY